MSKTLVDPFDQVALAARLAEARALRAVALAKKKQPDSDATRSTPKLGRAAAHAQLVSDIVSPEDSSATSRVLRADPGMRLARGPTRRISGPLAPKGLQRPTSDVPRSNGSVAPIVGLVAGCIIAGTAVLALRPVPPAEQTADMTPQQPDTVLQPTIVQAPAAIPLTPPHIGAPIEQALLVPTVTLVPHQQVSSDFVAASGQIEVAANELAETVPLAPRPAAGAAPQAPHAPLLRHSDSDATMLLHRPGATVAPRPALQVETIQVAALPTVSLPRRSPTISVTREPLSDAREMQGPADTPARAESTMSSQGQAPASSPEYRIVLDNLRTPPGLTGSITPGRSTKPRFILANLSEYGALFATTPINLWLETNTHSAKSAAPSGRARVRAASPVRAATSPDPSQAARVDVVVQSILERKVNRLLREQLRELRRR